MSEKDIKTKINIFNLFFGISGFIIGVLGLTSGPLFRHFFQGILVESVYPSAYTENYKGGPFYPHRFEYRHVDGNPIKNVTISIHVENSGSIIDHYEPFFKNLYKSKHIEQAYSERHVKLDIPEIRPNDEFSIVVYSKNRAKIYSQVNMANGRLQSRDENITNNAVLWVTVLIAGFLVLIRLYYKSIISSLNKELDRVISERNVLQSLELKGARLSASSVKKQK